MAGSATYQVSGPGGAVYQIEGPPGANPSEILGAVTGHAAAATPAPSGGWANDIALLGRDVGEGVFDTLAAPHDLSVAIANPVHRWMNRTLGTHYRPQHTISGQLSRALTFLGAPVPTTPEQRLAASAIRGTAGALTSMGALGLGGFGNAVRAALSGASGGTSADLAREAGAGPVWQFIAGTVGGLTPAALETGITAVPRLLAPLGRAGQAQLAANALVRDATNPQQAAQNLENATSLVPGSMRTSGEASGDTGILSLEKGVRARNPGRFGERISQQNAARQAELANLGGTPADIAAAEATRDAQTAPMRESAFAKARNLRQQNPLPSEDATVAPIAPRNYATSDTSQDSILQWLAKHPRGLDSSEAEAQGLDPSQFNAPESMVGIKRAFRRGGMSFDQAAEALHQAGYPVTDEFGNYSPNVLLDSIDNELRGAPSYSIGNTRRFAELEQQMGDENGTAESGTPQPLQNFPGRAPIQQVHATIDQLLASPAGARESIGKTLRWAKAMLGAHDDPETLYEVRKDLQLAQQDRLQPTGRDAPNATMLAQARGQLGQVVKALDDAIETAAPGYKNYLARYRELSEPIDQMGAIQGLAQRTSSGLDTNTGEPFLSAPQFTRQLRGTLDRSGSPTGVRFTPAQTQRLEAIREDLQRGSALSSPTVRTPGSDTFQNFMTGQRTASGLLPHTPFLSRFLAPVSKYIDNRVNEQLADAMLDPRYAAQLLRRGVVPRPIGPALGAGISRAALPASAGPIAALPRPTAATGLLPHPSMLTAWLESKLTPLTGLAPQGAPQAGWWLANPAEWARRINAGTPISAQANVHPGLQELRHQRRHAQLTSHVHRSLAGMNTGAVQAPGRALIVRTAPGRHVTILPPTFPGSAPQAFPGIVSVR